MMESHWSFIETAAAEMGIKPEALRKWRERGRVPYRHRLTLLDIAKRKRLRLDPRSFDTEKQN